MDLLDKTRKISKILQKNVGHHLVDFDQVAEALCDVIGANLYVVSPEGESSVWLSTMRSKMSGCRSISRIVNFRKSMLPC